MICIRQAKSESGYFTWTAEDVNGVIGRIIARGGDIPEIIELEFEQPEIGDGLIKTAAAFFVSAGVEKLRFSVNSDKARKIALAAGFTSAEKGLEINPAQVKKACSRH